VSLESSNEEGRIILASGSSFFFSFSSLWLVISILCVGPGVLVLRSQSSHPLDPLGPTEIAVAIATVRAAGATPEVRTLVLLRSFLLSLS
jgi:hypothetical protein